MAKQVVSSTVGVSPAANAGEAICLNCSFFSSNIPSSIAPHSAKGFGRCKRYPPSTAGFPTIAELDSCGEFKKAVGK